MSMRTVQLFLGVALSLAACGRPGETDAAKDSPMGGDTGMAGMPGMAMGDTSMMNQMQSHMSMMEGVSADSLMKMLPMHRMMVANMISQFNSDMGRMNMQPDARWQATVDSLRNDLTRMPELNANEISQMMPAHHARVMRLMDMHRAMMGRGKQ
ncbi:MAG TPA: hypothetical protein VGQ52_06930 [Gemmatimonadaceae bacterium]|jgi:hypothetical protein|nr:hypothetical protein [Gemmatimonadaceae bacterium]